MPSIKLLGGWDAVLKLGHSPWGELAQEGFYRGWKKPPEFKPGLTDEQAQKVLKIYKVVSGTFACKHEHKIATLAFLLDKFFIWDDALKG